MWIGNNLFKPNKLYLYILFLLLFGFICFTTKNIFMCKSFHTCMIFFCRTECKKLNDYIKQYEHFF